MASRRAPLVTRHVALPPYAWAMTREHSGTLWGVDLQISDDHVVALRAYRSLGGRWTWTVHQHHISKSELTYGTRIGRGIEATLTQAKPAAEAVTRDWLIEQTGPGTDDLH